MEFMMQFTPIGQVDMALSATSLGACIGAFHRKHNKFPEYLFVSPEEMARCYEDGDKRMWFIAEYLTELTFKELELLVEIENSLPPFCYCVGNKDSDLERFGSSGP